MSLSDRKVVLVTRNTRLEDLVVRHNTIGQAKFYIEHLGADFKDYVLEHDTYKLALDKTVRQLETLARVQLLPREYLPNFVFAPDDIVATLGQDGLVANTLKYLDAQPLVAVNPDPERWDGVLLPYKVNDVSSAVTHVLSDQYRVKSITMAQVSLNDGQKLLAVNDLFIGQRTHVSSRYEIAFKKQKERQSSSGIIVSTGLGSSGWMKSVINGAKSIASGGANKTRQTANKETLAWDARSLLFAVREPFPSRTTGTNIVFGEIESNTVLKITSEMPENGVIFSDGVEADYLAFTAGFEATISVSDSSGRLVY